MDRSASDAMVAAGSPVGDTVVLRDWSGTSLQGRFEVERRVGKGGMGTVYRAQDLDTGKPVAVKFMTPLADDRRVRFAREVVLLASIRHPGIVHYLADGEIEGQPYLITEWIDGGSLAAQLCGPGVNLAEAVDVVGQLAGALGHVHRLGLIHRDLKPSNVLMPPGRVVLIDFGLAKSVDDLALTRMGQLVGTPGYYSPEQARGEPHLDARTDVFALGCLAYLMIAGRSAFRGGSAAVARMRVLFEAPAPLQVVRPDAPAALRGLVERMLAREPGDRPAGADEILADLAALGPMPEAPRRVWAGDADITHVADQPPSDIPTVVDRPDGPVTATDWPFLVTASPDEDFTDYASAAERLAERMPDTEVVALGRQCLIVRMRDANRLADVAALVRSALADWPVVGASGLDSLEWAIDRLGVALIAAALAPPGEPAALVLR
jgi:serine/threonine protein kinase